MLTNFLSSSSSARIAFFIENFRGQTIQVDICIDDALDEVQTQIEQKTGIPAEEQHLCFAGQTLEGRRHISDYNIDMLTVLTVQEVVTPSAPKIEKKLTPMPPPGPPPGFIPRTSGCSSSQQASSGDVPTPPPPQAPKRPLQATVEERRPPPAASKRQKQNADKERRQKYSAGCAGGGRRGGLRSRGCG